MAFLLLALFSRLEEPKNYQKLSYDELISAYQRTEDTHIIVFLIRRVDEGTNHLSAIIRYFLKDKETQEEFVQELFVHLRKTLLNDNAIKKFEPWLKMVTRNKALDFLKSRNRKEKFKINYEKEVKETSGNAAVEIDSKMYAQELIERIKKELKEEEWLMILCMKSGGNLAECSAQFGLTPTQFRGRYQRALQKVQRQFGEDYKQLF